MSDPTPTPPVPAPAPPGGARPQGMTIERFLGGPPLWVAARLLMLSLVVGVILSVLGLDPFNIFQSLADFVRWIAYRLEDILHLGWDTIEWLIRYMLLGAAVVIPIWLIVRFAKTGGR